MKQNKIICRRCHDAQHNNTQFNIVQHNYNQYNDTQRNEPQANDTHYNYIKHTILSKTTISITPPSIMTLDSWCHCADPLMLSVTFSTVVVSVTKLIVVAPSIHNARWQHLPWMKASPLSSLL